MMCARTHHKFLFNGVRKKKEKGNEPEMYVSWPGRSRQMLIIRSNISQFSIVDREYALRWNIISAVHFYVDFSHS